MPFARRHLFAWLALFFVVAAIAPPSAVAQTDEPTPLPDDPVPATTTEPDTEEPVDPEAEEPTPPPPPQVSIAGLATGPGPTVDADLQSALFAVDLLDTWYALTPTVPELSMIAVDGAEESRTELIDAVDGIVTARETTAALLKASLDAAAEQRRLEGDREGLTETRAELVVDRETAVAHKEELVDAHAVLVEAIQQTSVGLYMAEQSVTVDLNDVVAYNDRLNRSTIIDAALEDLIDRRDVLSRQILDVTAEIEDLDTQISDTDRAIAATDVDIAARVETIGTLARRIDEAVAERTGLEELLPDLVLAHQDERMTAIVPSLGFSLVTLDAYVVASREVEEARPTCDIRWETISGISTIESNHARHGGASVGSDGAMEGEILGPVLDGSLEGTAVITDSDGGALDGDPVYDRAIGPFQFLPSTWRTHGLDADGDGDIDPHNLYDAALSAAGYLCATSNVSSDGDIERSVLSYNHSRVYLHDVTAAAHSIISRFGLPTAPYDPETIEISGDWSIEFVGTRVWHR